MEDTLVTMERVLGEWSGEVGDHGLRMAVFTRKTGALMGLGPNVLDRLEVLAALHDIGKVVVDRNILQKPGALTYEEWIEVRRHPEIGYRVVMDIPCLSDIADYILFHHERWDGKGYPKGLEGEDIPLMSRIISVLDAYDAITNDRPYRKALSKEFAKKELLDNSGTQFDPEVVRAFLSHLECSLT